MKDNDGCACGCGEQPRTVNGRPRTYIRGHNRRGKGKGWLMLGYRYISRDGQKIGEHRHIVEQQLGRKLTQNEVVHHIDGDKLNNDPSNLMVLTRSEHTRLHSTAKRSRWTEDEKRRAKELKEAGYTTQEVARMLRRSPASTIRYACNRRPRLDDATNAAGA